MFNKQSHRAQLSEFNHLNRDSGLGRPPMTKFVERSRVLRALNRGDESGQGSRFATRWSAKTLTSTPVEK
jgi:hypothetical protein